MNNFKNMTYLCMQRLTNFPYIEEDFDALTNYELLCKVVEYLNNVIVNENNQNDAINELATSFIELKNYVDNLDLQEEVNNKLDEMYESGQLSDLVAQYLGLAGIIGFDTVADMKLAENLVNGSKCQTLGFDNIKDGKGSLYRVRTVTSSDVVDNNNIIALHDNTLIAEKIDKFIKNNNCLLKLTKFDNGETYNFILSKSYDGINFESIMILPDVSIPHSAQNAAVNFCYTNNKFYIISSLGYWFSNDLFNWSEMQTFNISVSAPSIYNNKLYAHYKESNTSITNVIGGTTYPYSIKSYDITYNNDGTITLSNSTTLLEGDSTHSYIDPDVKEYKNNIYLACKDEIALSIKLYKLNNGSLTDTNFSHRGIGIEACKLIPTDSALYIYADPYALRTNYDNATNLNYPRNLSIRMLAINNETVNTDSLLTAINGLYEYHPSYNVFSDLKAVNIINSLQYTPILENTKILNRQQILSNTSNSTVISVMNHPTFLYYITGETGNKIAYLRFTKVFENSPLYLTFDSSMKTRISPAQGVNNITTSSSSYRLLKENETITAPVYTKSNGEFVYIPAEQNMYMRELKLLPTDASIFSSVVSTFDRDNTVNFFKIEGYNTDITVNLLPTSSTFFGVYYRSDASFGMIMLYRQGATIKEYRATISSGSPSEWTTII